jgi:hypothetical protein
MTLFSDDRDFRSIVEAVQRRGVHVTIVSSIACQPAMIADELRRQADEFVELRQLELRIRRDGERVRESKNEEHEAGLSRRASVASQNAGVANIQPSSALAIYQAIDIHAAGLA